MIRLLKIIRLYQSENFLLVLVAHSLIVLLFEQEMALEYLMLNLELAQGSAEPVDDMFELKEPLGIFLAEA